MYCSVTCNRGSHASWCPGFFLENSRTWKSTLVWSLRSCKVL